MAIFIYLLMFIGIVLILVGVLNPAKNMGVESRLPPALTEVKRPKIFLFFSYIFPFSKKFLEKVKVGEKMKNQLARAHIRFLPHEFFNLKLLLILCLGILVFAIVRGPKPLFLFVAFCAGYLLPDLWLRNRAKQLKQNIRRYLPETVDLLGLCVEAGLDFTSALKWIVEKRVFSNPMIDELVYVLDEIKWGKPRAQALKDMAKRLNIIEVSSFARLLIQAERMGTPITEAFNIISEDSRSQRFREGERYAMKAPIKILVPLIFFILPVIGIIVGGPIILRFTQGNLF